MRAKMIVIMACMYTCMQYVGAFSPSPSLVLRRVEMSCESFESRRSLGKWVMNTEKRVTKEKRMDRRQLMENGKQMLVVSSFSTLFQPLPVAAFPVPAGAVQGGKAGDLTNFLQGAVLECQNLEDEVAFWTQGLKMKILRKAAGRVVLGYGAESLEQEKGGHFSLELVQATQETKSSSKLKIELTLPARTNLIIDIQDAGGDLLPAWFGTTGYIAVASPNGFLVRIETTQEKEVGYPVKAVAIQTDDVQAVTKEFTSLLKLKADNGFQLPFSDPKSQTLRFIETGKEGNIGQAICLIIEPLNAPPPPQMSKAALLKKKQEDEAAAKEDEEEGEPPKTSVKVAPSNFILSLVSQRVSGDKQLSTGIRMRVLSNDSFEEAMPPPPPPQASAAVGAAPSRKLTKLTTRTPSAEEEEDE